MEEPIRAYRMLDEEFRAHIDRLWLIEGQMCVLGEYVEGAKLEKVLADMQALVETLRAIRYDEYEGACL